MTNDQVDETFQATHQSQSDDPAYKYIVGHFGIYEEPSHLWRVMHLRSRSVAGQFPKGMNAITYAAALDALPIRWDVSRPDCWKYVSEIGELYQRFKGKPFHPGRRTGCPLCGDRSS